MDKMPDDELISAYLDGELSPHEQAQAEQLLAENAAARQLLDELRALSAGLRAMSRATLEPDFCERVLQRAEQERQQQAQAAASADARPRRAAVAEVPNDDVSWRQRIARVVFWPALATAAALTLFYFDPSRQDRGVVERQVSRGDRPSLKDLNEGSGGPAGNGMFEPPQDDAAFPSISAASPAGDSSEPANASELARANRSADRPGSGTDRRDLGEYRKRIMPAANAAAEEATLEMADGVANAGHGAWDKVGTLPKKPAIEFIIASTSADVRSVESLFARADLQVRWFHASDHRDDDFAELGDEMAEGLYEKSGAPAAALSNGLGEVGPPGQPSPAKPPAAAKKDSPAPAAPAPSAHASSPALAPARPAAAAAVLADGPTADAAPGDSVAVSGESVDRYAQVAVEVIGSPEQVHRLVAAARASPDMFLEVREHSADDTAAQMARRRRDNAEKSKSDETSEKDDDPLAQSTAGDAGFARPKGDGKNGFAGGGAAFGQAKGRDADRGLADERKQGTDAQAERSATRSAGGQDRAEEESSPPMMARLLNLQPGSDVLAPGAAFDADGEQMVGRLPGSDARLRVELQRRSGMGRPLAGGSGAESSDEPSGEKQRLEEKPQQETAVDKKSAFFDDERESEKLAEKDNQARANGQPRQDRQGAEPPEKRDNEGSQSGVVNRAIRVILVFRASEPIAETAPAGPVAEPASNE